MDGYEGYAMGRIFCPSRLQLDDLSMQWQFLQTATPIVTFALLFYGVY